MCGRYAMYAPTHLTDDEVKTLRELNEEFDLEAQLRHAIRNTTSLLRRRRRLWLQRAGDHRRMFAGRYRSRTGSVTGHRLSLIVGAEFQLEDGPKLVVRQHDGFLHRRHLHWQPRPPDR